MAVAFFAAVDRFRNIVVTDGGTISSDNANFTTDGAGNITAVSLTASGTVTSASQSLTGAVTAGGLIFRTTGATVQTVTTSGTITITSNTVVQKLTTGGAVTAVVLTAGTTDGQTVVLVNTSANSITFAAAGTSNVADGTSGVIAANRSMVLWWESTTARWYRS